MENPISKGTYDMSLSEFAKGQFWQIHPPAFEDLCRRVMQSDTAADCSKYLGDNSAAAPDFYSLAGSTAIIAVNGPLSKSDGFFTCFFGGTSYAGIQRALAAAMDDEAVENVVLRISSPGGVVSGLEDTVDMVYEARGRKPVVAYADGMMASAAYEIGSAAGEIVAGGTAMVGSIGVLMVHEDWSKWNEKMGIDVTYLAAGRYKALGNPDEPLSDLARQTFQAELNTLYSLFVETVARNREVETEKVLADMADGRIFIGQAAMDGGLVDRIGNINLAVERARALPAPNFNSTPYGGEKMAETIDINMQIIEEQAPELLARIREDAARQGHEEGVLEERVRVTEIMNAAADGDETRRAIEDGTPAAEAYKTFYEAERDKRARGLKDLAALATEPVTVSEPEPAAAAGEKTPEQQRVEWRPLSGPRAA